jgi:hypothetical protein
MRVCTIFIGPDFYTGRFCLLLFKLDNVKQTKLFIGGSPLGNFKGRYAGRIGRQDWKSLNFSCDKKKRKRLKNEKTIKCNTSLNDTGFYKHSVRRDYFILMFFCFLLFGLYHTNL